MLLPRIHGCACIEHFGDNNCRLHPAPPKQPSTTSTAHVWFPAPYVTFAEQSADLIDAWVDAFAGHSDIARQRAFRAWLPHYEADPRAVISELAWVLAKSKQRKRREAVDELLDRLTRRSRREDGL